MDTGIKTKENKNHMNAAGGRAGILNIQNVDNYGAVLLCYALQETVKKFGYDVEIIDYRPPVIIEKNGIFRKIQKKFRDNGIRGIYEGFISKIFGKTGTSVNFSSERKALNFAQFRTEHLQRGVICRGVSDAENLDYDVYIVGSDVVWKPGRVLSGEADIYFLNFTEGRNCLRISYAASIGTDDEQKLLEMAPKFEQMIAKFDSVSVREKDTVAYVEALYHKPVFWCMDPTLLLLRQDYEKLISKEKNQKEYIYLYLFEDSNRTYEIVNKYSKEMNLPVICQCANLRKVNRVLEYSKDDGPLEFLERIRDASFVITDSFHGTVFSTIFEKEFITLSRGKLSIRMENFLERLDLFNHFIPESQENVIIREKINYEEIQNKISEWRTESLDYLKKSLNILN